MSTQTRRWSIRNNCALGLSEIQAAIYLTVQAKGDQHHKEQYRPQLWNRQVTHNFRVGDESEAGACKQTTECELAVDVNKTEALLCINPFKSCQSAF